MMIDSSNPVIKLCIEGTQAEFRGEIDLAHSYYQKAWESAQDDYEACIAAHYVARHQDDPQQKLHWNQIALYKAKTVKDGRVDEFYPSLFLNMGQSYDLLGKREEAKRYYNFAAELGVHHQEES
jgi:tetratricopeptide (TPR) repeat protein